MRGGFIRERAPDWLTYANGQGLTLAGRGKWRTVRCDFHDDGEPSMRVNVESGAWVCMACGTKGGDVLSHFMERSGASFIEAARALGAWDEGPALGNPTSNKPTTLAPRDAMEVIALDLLTAVVVISDIRQGTIPTDQDWQSFINSAGRIEALVMEYRT